MNPLLPSFQAFAACWRVLAVLRPRSFANIPTRRGCTWLALLAVILVSYHSAVMALPAWRDLAVIQVNTEPARASFVPFETVALAQANEPAQSRYVHSLDGRWAFRFSGSPAERPPGFWRSDYDIRDWASIEVPSVWERQGYGYPVYVNHAYPFHAQPFEVPDDEQNHVGSYVRHFEVPEHWDGRRIFIHFGAVSSAFTVWINGEQVGYS